MQHIWKALLTSLLIFALAATACLAEDSEAQYQAYSYTTFSLRRTPSESDRGISVQKNGAIDSYPTLEQMEQPETDFSLP